MLRKILWEKTALCKHFFKQNNTVQICSNFISGMYPCGITPLFSQLYGSEGVCQVHGILSDFFSANNHEVKKLVYDDACHLCKYARNLERMAYSDGCRFMGQLDMKIDRLHYPNHVDPWCKKHMNPKKDKDLEGVNTVVVEQSFKHYNKYKNCKTMNSVRFHFLFLYMIDLNNLDRVGRLGFQVHPQYELDQPIAQPSSEIQVPVHENESPAERDHEPEKLEKDKGNFPYQCPECEKRFRANHGLTRHSNQMHPKVNNNVEKNTCPKCNKAFSSISTLNRHKRESKTCKEQ